MENFKIALSAGHGRYTAGKRCMKKLDPNQTREWVLNSRIADKVEQLLRAGYSGWELLRVDDRTGAKDVSLRNRSDAANAWGADLYLAIHHNAAGVLVPTWKGGGIVAFVHTKPSTDSVAWQKDLYNALIAETGLKGNRSQPIAKANFHECREPKMAAVLLELGFMDSAIDVPIILTEEYADQCARAIVKVIAQRGKLTSKTGGTVTENTAAQETTKAEQPAQTEVKVDPAKQFGKAKAGTYKVKSHDGCLNLRSGPAIGKTLIETMPNGTTFRCYGYYTGDWLYGISASGKRGFCHGGYLEKV